MLSQRMNRWGYAYAYFLHNPGSSKPLDITFNTCSDVAIYILTGDVTGESLGTGGELVYHRFPGNDADFGCPCDDITPSITIPSGAFRLAILTRGSDCVSYLRWPESNYNWISENGLSIDWDNLRVFLGEDLR